jgi:hypothetical protein
MRGWHEGSVYPEMNNAYVIQSRIDHGGHGMVTKSQLWRQLIIYLISRFYTGNLKERPTQ